MARRVFGRMKQQPEHIRRQLGSTDATELEKLLSRGPAELIEGAIDLRGRDADKFSHRGWWRARIAFGTRSCLLFVGQRLSPRVGQETIEGAAKMTDMKADRCGAARSKPDVLGWHLRGDLLEVFTGLDQRMSNRHQHGIDALDWSAHPDFSLLGIGHAAQCTKHVACMY